MHRLKALLCFAACALMLTACAAQPVQSRPAGQDFTTVPGGAASSQTQAAPADLSRMKYRAIWISYLDWKLLDTSSAQAFTKSAGAMFDNCVSLGLNVVIVQVRPFGDAVYPSKIFPWSHLVTGTQGKDPGYDPFAIMVEQAHARGLAIEAWVNPYRVRLSDKMPERLADTNPALTHSDWAISAENGLYYNPALPEVQKMIVDGAVEIVQNYAVDGLQFDDYFYPTTDPSFDTESYVALSGGKELSAWRRDNVNALVRSVYSGVKAARPTVQFGISPQGNNDQNYNTQYSDVGLWMSEPGYVDYIMPQVYWGYGYTLKSGSNRFAFENVTQEWLAMPRHESVSLAFGLGAYRIGAGDGGQNDQTQWQSGHNLADMVKTLSAAEKANGYALYRYEQLFANSEYGTLAAAECEALKSLH